MSSAEQAPTPSSAAELASLAAVVEAVELVVRDKTDQIRLALAAMLSGGHVLIEDAPGMGKTSLARALAHHLQLDWKRLQCTNDTTPSDIVGVNMFDPKSGDFDFRSGPVFTQLLLADELNRAPSKSQSALLEAMAERQVTIDGAGRQLPDPFIVIATQNPTEQIGVSPLPESQLDRFAVSFSLGLPASVSVDSSGLGWVGLNRPILGISQAMQLTDIPAPAQSIGLAVIGFQAIPNGADLGFIGAPGCSLYTQSSSIQVMNYPILGSSHFWLLPIPNNPALAGTTVTTQGLVKMPATFNPGGFLSSNGVELLLGTL